MPFASTPRLLASLLLAAATSTLLAGADAAPATDDAAAETDLDLELFGRDPIEVGGRIKALGLALDVPPGLGAPELDREWSGAASLRLQLEGSPTSWLDYQVHARLEAVRYGAPELARLTRGTVTETTLFRGFDLERSWHETPTERLGTELDYANVRFTFGSNDITLGRQAITFGRSFLWNPTDWLGTFSPTEIDREFKGGVDAARFSFGLGRLDGVELIYAYGGSGSRDDGAIVARGYANWAGWDVDLLAGSVWIDDRLGAAWSGDVGGAGVRGEVSWERPRIEGEREFVRATLEVDYKWPSSLQLITELHYNGFGTGDPARYAELFRHPRVTTGQVTNIGRRYAGAVLSYELTPLLTTSNAVLWNLDDGSGLVNPTLVRSLSNESSLVAGVILPWGKRPRDGRLRSELGSTARTLWVQLRWSF